MGDILFFIVIIGIIIVFALYKLNQVALKKMNEQEGFIEKNKQFASIFVIDKKKDKIANSNLPKVVVEKVPWTYKFIKVPLVKAKVGAQIVTLMCDKKVFQALPVKKSVKVEIAGIYIVKVQGMKSDEELKKIKKEKKEKNKENKK